MGKITVKNSNKNELSFQKKRWREWCILHTKDDKGILKVMVENTSFTGNDGCELVWELSISKNTELTLSQDAGTIKGDGSLKDLKINLAAGNLVWENSFQPLTVQVSAGNVEFKNAQFPKSGKSKINVATGNVALTSPSESPITSLITTAVGPGENQFSEKKDGHTLEVNVALGKASHTKL